MTPKHNRFYREPATLDEALEATLLDCQEENVKLRAERDAALAENERLREDLAGACEFISCTEHAGAEKRFNTHLVAARQLLADTTDAVAGMQNELQAKKL